MKGLKVLRKKEFKFKECVYLENCLIEIEQLRRFKKIIYINPKQLTEQPGAENKS